ncbi:DMT family transporter [Sandaracinobacter sp. RS1-74]|uniref:DMT family transporter n=1 Tax=Sandaracinobacteroides sayramensis TaxID=2913411 RepID=UPI001EDA0E82|nr:DMT family transporter [Sandaracinobacteroides sayramensis]MCG2841892.1 DMT family transporter [Sandaracinobacteroides sayramensis]
MRGGPILLYIIGIAIFCAMDAVMKWLVVGNPAIVATFWRYLSAIFFTALIWIGAGRPAITREMLPVHAIRGAVIAISATLFFWSLTILPLAQAVTIAFIAPLLIPPIASVMLKERMRAGSVAAGLIGFLGVIVAVGFDPASLSADKLRGVGAVLVSALCYAVTVVLMRMRAARDGPAVLSLLGAIFPALVLLPPALLTAPAAALVPRGETLAFVALAGLFGAIALQFLARAYARVEAQVLAPFEYTALVWAALYGWLFFAEPVSLRIWLGAAIIAGACLWQTRRPA